MSRVGTISILAAGATLLIAMPAVAQRPPLPDPDVLRGRLLSMADRAAEQLFARADANGDGLLTRQEISAFSASVGGSDAIDPQTWKTADANHDGYVSLGELKAAIRRVMDSAR